LTVPALGPIEHREQPDVESEHVCGGVVSQFLVLKNVLDDAEPSAMIARVFLAWWHPQEALCGATGVEILSKNPSVTRLAAPGSVAMLTNWSLDGSQSSNKSPSAWSVSKEQQSRPGIESATILTCGGK
jgi:hypothetical protein